MSEKNSFKVRLMRWGDSSSSGRTVTLKLPDDTDEHPFKGLPVGSRNGQLMEMEITLLEGDAELETMGPKKRTPKFPVTARGSTGASGGALTDQTGTGGGGSSSSGRPDSGTGAASDSASSGGSGTDVGSGVAGTGKSVETGPIVGKDASDTTAAISGSSVNKLEESESASHGGVVISDRAHDEEAETAAMSETTNQQSDSSDVSAAVAGQGVGMGGGVGQEQVMGGGGGGAGGGTGGSGVAADGANLERYADHMSHAAEALAAVAERMDGPDDEPQIQTRVQEQEEDDLDPGEKAVIRATDLCKAIDQQRAGFFYYMMSKYPSVPQLQPETGNWSRDARATRDRLCHHCDTSALGGLADSTTARRKFEELEKEFERHDRIR